MRQNPRLNNENRQLMEEILRQTVAMFPTPEFCLPFIGTILYLKKIGAELIDVQSGENGAFPPTRDGCIHSLSMRERG